MYENTLIVVVGPTAVGKTATAVSLAKEFNCDVISSDSRQFYKEMSVGTAKPTIQEMKGIKHHFINSLSIKDDYSVAHFETQALQLLPSLFNQNPIQVVAGGSGLFVRTLLEGIDYFPDVDPQIRKDLTLLWENEGINPLIEKLKVLDSEYFLEVDQGNPQRLIRALEICIGTGKPFSSFRVKKNNLRNFNVIKIGLEVERNLLYEKINHRVDLMMENGQKEEAKKLHSNRGLVPLKTVGYSELFDYFEGLYDLNRAIELIKRNSRRYAKRQLTWFKKDDNTKWFDPKQFNEILKHIKENLKLE